jgi:hypothetical protein
MGKRWIAALAALVLAACSQTQRVEKPVGEVHASLANMAPEADVMDMAASFPGTTYFLDAGGDQLVWHFTHDGKDYGRFVASLEADGPDATKVTTYFENASDADLASDLGFLRKMAKQAAEVSVAAALAGHSADRAALGQQFQAMMITSPIAAQKAVTATIADQMNRISDDMDAMAPEDPCLSDDDAARERCETFEWNRENAPVEDTSIEREAAIEGIEDR